MSKGRREERILIPASAKSKIQAVRQRGDAQTSSHLCESKAAC